jgi:Glycosyl transferase family 2
MPPSPEPRVSVIIPNYNHARYLGDAIRSVLAQTRPSHEVIVVDDGSTDESRTVAGEYASSITYIYQSNAGLSAARNTGIRQSSGSLIAVLDADDMYEPDYLRVLVSALEQEPDAGGIYCGYRFVDHENRALPQVESRPIDPGGLHAALLDGNFLVPESVVLRRGVYEQVGLFDESLRACEDWDVWLRAASAHRIIHSPRVLTRHRVLPGSMSTDPERMLTNRLSVLVKHVGGEPADTGTSSAHRAFGRAYLGSCVEFLQYGDEERAYRCLRSMAERCPSLLCEVDTCYQLGCGRQPKGSMGDLASLAVPPNGSPLLPLLDRLFGEPELPDRLQITRGPAYATALGTLGILAHGQVVPHASAAARPCPVARCRHPRDVGEVDDAAPNG